MAINHDEIEHLRLREHRDVSACNLPTERLVCTEEKLLTGLAARIKGSRHLCSAKGAIGQQTAVFPCKRHPLLDTMIDDQIADFCEPINIRFAGTKIATFDGVVEQTENTIAIVLVILRGIDSALSGNAMGAAWAILITEAFHVVTQLAQCGSRGGTRKAAADY